MRCQSLTRPVYKKPGPATTGKIEYKRCSRKATVIVEIPMGETTIRKKYCQECADRRKEAAAIHRGAELIIEPIHA